MIGWYCLIAKILSVYTVWLLRKWGFKWLFPTWWWDSGRQELQLPLLIFPDAIELSIIQISKYHNHDLLSDWMCCETDGYFLWFSVFPLSWIDLFGFGSLYIINKMLCFCFLSISLLSSVVCLYISIHWCATECWVHRAGKYGLQNGEQSN